jgi:4a-hydroxytetrahydrobiopterin dehydratase
LLCSVITEDKLKGDFFLMGKEFLESKKCSACSGLSEPLSSKEIPPLLAQLDGWVVEGEKRLEKTFHFKDFTKPLQLLNAVAFVSEIQGHHPDMELSWGRLFIRIYTHKINGLHLNDFILAKKIDEICRVSS